MGIREKVRRSSRHMSVAVEVGVPVILISMVAFALLGALSISEATQRINERYLVEADVLTRLVHESYMDASGDAQQVNSYLQELNRTHPAVDRIQVIKSGTGEAPFVWASSSSSDLAMSFGPDLVPQQSQTLQRETTLNGVPELLLVEPMGLPHESISMATYFSLGPRKEAIAGLTRRIALECTAVLLFELVALGLTIYVIVLRRVKRLGRAAEAVAAGDLSVRLPEGAEAPARDELFNVAREFDLMVEAVGERAQELEESAARERTVAEHLRELDSVKNTLLHSVSHDLRGPITSILGSASTLERAEELNLSQADRRTLATGLSSAARKMNRLVTDLLDLDRIERGIASPKREPTDIAELVRGVLDELAFASARPLHAELQPVQIAVDASKVERIVENLLANTLTHTPPGTDVWVKVQREGDAALLVVEDAGPGIPNELQHNIFEPFEQGGDEARRAGGVGIGLSVVARFAKLHGGRAWVTDREGGGASFRVLIPDGTPGSEEDWEN